MGKLRSLVKLMTGAAIGFGAGNAAAKLLTPESGDDLRARIEAYRANVLYAGRSARVVREAELTAQYRYAVRNDSALEPASRAFAEDVVVTSS